VLTEYILAGILPVVFIGAFAYALIGGLLSEIRAASPASKEVTK
jgi:hypothetical protein